MLHIAVTARALFKEDPRLTQAREGKKWEEYEGVNKASVNEAFEEGPMLGVLRKLQPLMNKLSPEKGLVRISVFSKGGAHTAARTLASLESYGLNVSSVFFTNGGSRTALAKGMGIDMFFTTNEEDARDILKAGIPAAKVSRDGVCGTSEKFFVLFDVDAVLVDDSSEKVAKVSLESFQELEKTSKEKLKEGPIAPFARKLCELKAVSPDLISLGILTARSPAAHRRVLEFFRDYGIEPDFQAFMGGQAKGPVAAAVGADILLDDHHKNCASAESSGVLAGHVLFGVNNPEPQVMA